MSEPASTTPLLPVHFSFRLAGKLGADAQGLVELVREWKVVENGQVVTLNHYAFGRDKPNNPVRGYDKSFAWHAHLAPHESTSEYAAWYSRFEDDDLTAYDRTSDRLMFYSLKLNSPAKGLLILDVVDPGGHEALRTWKNPLRIMDTAAQRHQENGVLPPKAVSF